MGSINDSLLRTTLEEMDIDFKRFSISFGERCLNEDFDIQKEFDQLKLERRSSELAKEKVKKALKPFLTQQIKE